MQNDEEIFKPIPNLPGYFISNQGRVRRGNTKILRPFKRKYHQEMQITSDGVRVRLTISKIVKSVFGAIEK